MVGNLKLGENHESFVQICPEKMKDEMILFAMHCTAARMPRLISAPLGDSKETARKSQMRMRRSPRFRSMRWSLCLAVMLSLPAFLWTQNTPQVYADGKKRPVAAPLNPPKTYLTSIAESGENVVQLLERFGLHLYECNAKQFFEINKMAEDANLKTGKTYKLPVVIYDYNGKSIRSTTGVKNWQAAKRIEAYNRDALEQGLREDDFIRSRKLWVPWHELSCAEGIVDEAAPIRGKRPKPVPAEPASGKDQRSFAIFGSKYAKTPLISQRLKGRVFYLVSGHAGPDPGAQGRRAGHTLCEDEYAYDVTLRLLKLLLSHGATAYMIVRDPNDGIRDEAYLRCDKDEVVWGNLTIPAPQRERLQQRSDLINEMTEQNTKAGIANQTLIEIHVDSRSQHTETDVFFYFRPESEPSRQLALRMHRTFEQKYRSKQSQRGYSGTVTDRGLFMLTETTTPKAVYIELGNIQNDWDQQRLVLKNNRQALANWLCTAVLGE